MLKPLSGFFNLSIGVTLSLTAPVCAQKAVPFSAAQTRTIPLNAESWTYSPGVAEFLADAPAIGTIHPEGPALKIINPEGGAVIAKNIDFSEGTIDFDIQPTDSSFASFYFHRQDEQESECFYFRTTWAAGHPEIMEGVQYTPVIKGVNLWNLLPYDQGNANFDRNRWNHVRILIAGRQMQVFVNTDLKPTLTIPMLEGNSTHGSFAFEGQMVVAHLVVRALPPATLVSVSEIYDPTDNDPRYIRHWQVTQPDTIPAGVDFATSLMPGPKTAWSAISAERRGLINLTRLYGSLPRRPDAVPARRIVWLKTTLKSEREWNYKLNLGFTNEVWVFLNGKYVFIDKNFYGEPSMKTPRGRMSIDNSSFYLPLKEGDNELLIGVGNNFFGWGIAARLDDNRGLKFE
jgi:hypothetical protein